MSNPQQIDNTMTEKGSNDCDPDSGTSHTHTEANDQATASNATNTNTPVPVVGEIFLLNGQPMNAKTTLQSFDTPVSRSIVADAVRMRINDDTDLNIHQEKEGRNIQHKPVFLPTGELINAKNTVRSYDADIENQRNMVVAEVIQNNHNPNRRQFDDELNVEAYAVQSFIEARLAPIRARLTKRFVFLLLFMIVIGSTIIGTSVYCGLGNCTPPTPTSPTPTSNATLSTTSTISTKESAITAYINSITLTNRKIRVNGSTAEDLALTWIVHDDPIFINIDGDIWSTLLSASSDTSALSSTHIRLRQRYALLSLWFQQPLQTEGSTTVIHHWRNTSGWLQNDNECVYPFWYGIKCSWIELGGFLGRQRIVTEIDFFNNDGTFEGGNNVTGTIPPDIGLLTSLNRIDLSDNHFHGTISHSMLEQWVSIESINIGNNEITGTIPSSIGLLHTLRLLDINKNQISGGIPGSIGQCTALERFDAGDNQLTGPLPDTIGDLAFIKVFDVQTNHLSGTLPTSIGNWTAMTDFYIYENRFYGTLPDVIGAWTAVENLNIEYNMFTGTLPDSIGELSAVKRFDVSDNLLTGPIPESIGNCTSLVFFSIEDNAFDGTIPESIGMLTSLTALFLYSNGLDGTIPAVVGRFTSLRLMSFENNRLSGKIPLSVGNWSDIGW